MLRCEIINITKYINKTLPSINGAHCPYSVHIAQVSVVDHAAFMTLAFTYVGISSARVCLCHLMQHLEHSARPFYAQ